MTSPRQAKLLNAHEACMNAARALEMDFPLSELDDPMTAPGRREIVEIRQRDVKSLRLAGSTAMAIAAAPDAYADLISLRAKSISAFDAIMVLVRIELERSAPADEAKAA